jgi:hypothetical protein
LSSTTCINDVICSNHFLQTFGAFPDTLFGTIILHYFIQRQQKTGVLTTYTTGSGQQQISGGISVSIPCIFSTFCFTGELLLPAAGFPLGLALADGGPWI